MIPNRNKHKATSSHFPSKIIAMLETTLSTAQHNKEHTHKEDKTMGAKLETMKQQQQYNQSLRTDSSRSHCWGGRRLRLILLAKYPVVKTQNVFSCRKGFLTILWKRCTCLLLIFFFFFFFLILYSTPGSMFVFA